MNYNEMAMIYTSSDILIKDVKDVPLGAFGAFLVFAPALIPIVVISGMVTQWHIIVLAIALAAAALISVPIFISHCKYVKYKKREQRILETGRHADGVVVGVEYKNGYVLTYEITDQSGHKRARVCQRALGNYDKMQIDRLKDQPFKVIYGEEENMFFIMDKPQNKTKI